MSENTRLRQGADSVLAAAEKALAASFGGPVRLRSGDAQGGSDRSKVLRCHVVEAPDGSPESVIVKRGQGTPERPYDPDDAPPMSAAWRLFNEWAGAEFLTRVGGEEPLAPRFLGGDRDLGLVILEDIGTGESLANLLLGSDAARAEAGLTAFAVTLGRMHARTAGRSDAYAGLRAALGPFDGDLAHLGDHVRESLPTLRAISDPLGVAFPPGAEAEAVAVAETVEHPGPFLVYTHGDPCPDNNRYHDGTGLRLFDWEFGAFRHALLDGVYGRVPFPTCWCVNRLPVDIPARMEAAYRAELVRGCPEAADDALFDQAVAHACAYWTLFTAAWQAKSLMEKDDTWGISSMRQRLLLRLGLFAKTADARGRLPHLAAYARDLGARLRPLWAADGVEEMPLYPAFRQAPT